MAVSRALRHRWLYVGGNLTRPESLESRLALLPRAQAAGYNTIVLSDGTFQRLDKTDPSLYENYRVFQRAARDRGLDLLPGIMSFGYGGAFLGHDRNLAEGLPVKEALFVVRGQAAVHRPDPAIELKDGGFEAAEGDRFTAWDGQDDAGRSIFADHAVVHGGRTSVRMENFPPAKEDEPQSRVWQVVRVRPLAQYRISFWVKCEDLDTPAGVVTVCARSGKHPARQLNFTELPLARTQDWTRFHVDFNSLEDEKIILYVGTWGAKSGRLWWDDVSLQELGLVNVLRRPGCPVAVRGEDGTVYEEGRDFAPISDPNFHLANDDHPSPTIALLPGSRLRDGDRLRVSYYHPVVMWAHQIVNCLSEPVIFELVEDQVRRVEELLHPSGFFMQHDEIRVVNWCQACQSLGKDAGGVVGENVRRCLEIIRRYRPDAKVWAWSDMYDPFHNAGVGFPERDSEFHYLNNGPLGGAWEALPSEVGIVNWGSHVPEKNLRWFAERGHEQVLAGYYDGDMDGARIVSWLAKGEGLPNITGAMYTTWQNGYDTMEAWAKAAWGE